MILLLALVIGILFGCGIFLMLKRDLIRVIIGVNVLSSGVNLFIIAASVRRGAVPIFPQEPGSPFADPLAQALVLTAVVISFGLTTLLLALVYRIYTSHGTLDERAIEAATQEWTARQEEAAVRWQEEREP